MAIVRGWFYLLRSRWFPIWCIS